MWESIKTAQRGRFIALIACVRNVQSSQINNLNSYLRKIETVNQKKLKANRRNEIIKIRVEMNVIQNRNTVVLLY